MRAIRVLAAARARSRIICLNGADGTSRARRLGRRPADALLLPLSRGWHVPRPAHGPAGTAPNGASAVLVAALCLSGADGTSRAPRLGRRPGSHLAPHLICGARSADPGFSGRAERLASPESAQSSSSQNRRHWSRFGQGIRLPRTSGRRLGRGQPPACLARSAPRR